jgi:predicted TIM-barrel fold metal-dependent hydrolase
MKRSTGYGIAIVFFVCLAVGFLVRRHSRKGQEEPAILSGAALAEFTSLDPIDAHTHISQTGPAFLAMLQRLHLHVLDILYVDDTDPYRTSLETQKQDALKFVAASAGHAQLCTTFDPFQFNKPNFSQDAINGLTQDFKQGVVAVKIWKNVGMEIRKSSGQYLMPDDPMFAPLYQDIAVRQKTLITHVADPDTAWGVQAAMGFSTKYYEQNPQWDMSRKPGAPEKKTILLARDRLLQMNPKLRVIGAHFGSMEEHLDDLGILLDRYPNFAVDTAARVQRLVFQPRERVLAFMMKYQDRILYGSDLHFYSGTTDLKAAQSWENQYVRDWRYFATDDTFEYQGRRVEGLNLPRSVLQKVYHDNAVRWIPGIEVNRNEDNSR